MVFLSYFVHLLPAFERQSLSNLFCDPYKIVSLFLWSAIP